MRRAALLIGLSGCWHGPSQPTTPTAAPEPDSDAPTSSYRASTIAVDAIGVAAMTVGMVGLQRGGHDDASHGLVLGGMAAAAYISPIIHLVRGTKARAGGSWLIRSLSATTGMIVGLGAADCSRQPSFSQLDCSITGMLWGITGGLAIAGAIDAFTLHDTRRESRRWTPLVVPAPGGAQVGVGGAF